jgi:FkbM family methyltransferase
MEKLRKIFIDCGAWTGDSIKAFKSYESKESYSYEIYGFECEPRLKETLEKLSKQIDFKFIDKAVWTKNEKIKLYLGQNNLTQSSSVLSGKKKYIDKNKPVKVKAIDFSKWIIENFEKSDYIICKMNIEGAEYDILEKMLKDNSIDYIDKLFISWHWKKIKDITKERHDKLKEKIEKRTTIVKWKFVERETENPFI